ncbi:hypothetical protein MMC07_004474 [Pseudocyphellaria aurata]|nr:hypothetical protein [Pseudocyphellaria aurata]
MRPDGTWNYPFDWDSQWGAQEGDQVAPAGALEATAPPEFPPTAPHDFDLSSYGGDYSCGDAPDTMFTSGEATRKDQGPAIGTTQDNHDTISPGLLPDQEAVDYSGSGLSLPSTGDGTNGCTCISCFVKEPREFRKTSSKVYHCIVGCSFECESWYALRRRNHLETHFYHRQDEKYHCIAPHCNQTFGRWGELTRHNKTHCLRPKKFACDVLGCKYSGDNGFIRHDKLLSHKRNVHVGKAPPSQLMRTLKAKPQA